MNIVSFKDLKPGDVFFTSDIGHSHFLKIIPDFDGNNTVSLVDYALAILPEDKPVWLEGNVNDILYRINYVAVV